MNTSNSAPSSPNAPPRSASGNPARDIELGLLEGIHRRLPEHPAVMESLGCLYTDAGRYSEGLETDRKMVRLQPHSPLAWYNLACSLSLTGQTNDAFAALEKAVGLGYADAVWMQKDDDLAALRSDPRFAGILALIHARAAKSAAGAPPLQA